MAQAAMYGGKDTCMPFNGARRLPLLEIWRRVFDDCADDCGWGPDMRNLLATFVEETVTLDASLIDVNASWVLTCHTN